MIIFTISYITSVVLTLLILKLANKYKVFKGLCLLDSEVNYNILVFSIFIPFWNTLVLLTCLYILLEESIRLLVRKLPFSLSLVKLVKKIVE